jgi:hypothetical protein
MNLQIYKNHFININEQFKNNSFNKAINILTNKNNIQQTNNFLLSLQNLIKYEKEIISPKILLSSFLICYFHNDVLSEEKNDIDSFILDKSKFIVEITIKLSIQNKIEILTYISELNKFKHYFEQWKKKDLDSQLQIYKQMYFDSQFNPEIKNKIQKLIGKEKTNKLLIITTDNIQKNLKKAFWNNIKEEFENENYSQISSIIKDIKFFFILINNHLKEKLDEYLDIEFINMYIETNNVKQLFEVIKFCLIELKELDAPIYDEINEHLQQLNANTQNFILTLSFLLERLEFVSSLKK